MADSLGSYDLKVEFLEGNQSIDEEDEFRNFCISMLESSHSAEASRPHASNAAESKATAPPRAANNGLQLSVPTTIKRIKPSYVQTLRPASAQVLEDDVRISYARIIFNTINGCEREDIGQKLVSFCEEDCVMTVKWIGERGNPCGPNYREVKGLQSVISYLEAILVTAVPDAVMQLQDSKLRVKPDKSSYLLCKYTFSGTQLTKIEPIPTTNTGFSVGGFSLGGGGGGGDRHLEDSGHTSNSDDAEQATKKARNEKDASDASSAPASVHTASTAAVSIPVDLSTTTNVSSAGSVSSNGSGSSRTHTAASTAGAAAKGKGKRELDAPVVIEPGSIVDRQQMAGTALLPKAIKMNVVGTLIIHINPRNKIHRFEYIQKVVRLA